ncbi:MAG: lipopolysaccharide transport periplasmic protein LptA [Desulfobacteraceae bacterium]|nr:lipopolysaccharide transport periplasmic protein LptA [Desulfobacteraceae bacterium]MCB9494895.1 lipopolysaccharide transport periplasmic protein LptA [Desulfobacteraceae bacterium]
MDFKNFAAALLIIFFFSCSVCMAETEKKSEPINIRADSMKIIQDKNITVFTGNVKVTKGKTLISCNELIVHYKTSENVNSSPDRNSFDTIEAKGDVRVQMDDKKAKAENAVFDSKNEILVLSGGRPEIIDGDNKISGDTITYFIKTGVMEASRKTGSQVEVTFTNE